MENQSLHTQNIIDLDEKTLYQEHPHILKILLKNQTTKKNIVWGTPSYSFLGKDFTSISPIKVKQIIAFPDLIQPRVAKSQLEQKERTKSSAEVFTPTWLVDKQRNFVDREFQELSLQEFVDLRWLEITCGEAPYIVSRYDTVTGEFLSVEKRVGFLDKKLQRISKEITDKEEWLNWVKRAYQSSYGYEYQGDSLLLARENLLMTFMDYYENQFQEEVSATELRDIATIISYNLVQMDGLTGQIPGSREHVEQQLSLFDEVVEEKVQKEKGAFKNWTENTMIGFERLSSGEENMKFDVVIGNPPYQEETEGTSDKQIYYHFIDGAIEIADKSCLITPARFLFNAGKTPKAWNKKMLHDEHFKVLYYEQKSGKVFLGTDIKGGVAITFYDRSKFFGEISTFTPFEELNRIFHKVMENNSFKSLSNYVYSPESYKLTELLHKDFPHIEKRLSKGHKYDITTNIFDKLEDVFLDLDQEIPSSVEYVEFIGRQNNRRVRKWIAKKYIKAPDNLEHYKIIVPKSNGSGALGEVLSTPLIGEPLIGHTQSFISIGNFATLTEAENCFKYIKGKFVRAMLGVLKITQDNKKATWGYVPWQDFTSSSDIDWSMSVAEIDAQLYAKYGLSEEEIAFIEEKVRAMD